MIGRAVRAALSIARRRIRFELDLIPLEFKDVPARKLVNWLLTESSVLVKPARPWGLPTILQVEPTSRCNLHCTFCPVSNGLNRPAGNMDAALFRRIVDELSDYLLVIMFWDWGEPFLNPDAFEMIRYARSKGIKVACSTNGHIFSDSDNARQVVDSGLDVLIFSVDGLKQETYQRHRTGGKLDTVLEGIGNIVEQKRRLASETPIINFRYIVMKDGEQELEHLDKFAQALGVDVLTLRKFHAVPGSETYTSELIPEQRKFQLPALSGDNMHPVRAARNPCRNLWNCPTIHWDGTVCSCFMDYNESRPLGSLADKSFHEIWHGEAYRRLRSEFRKRWRDLPLCGECTSGYIDGDVGKHANAGAKFYTTRNRGDSP